MTEEPLSADEVASRVTNPYSGATLVFVGTVREWTKGKRTTLLEYEAYPEMAVAQMQVIGREIEQRWPGARTAIVHRVGRLEVTEPSVIIAVATPHRADSFEACRHAIERLKQIVPIWKKRSGKTAKSGSAASWAPTGCLGIRHKNRARSTNAAGFLFSGAYAAQSAATALTRPPGDATGSPGPVRPGRSCA